MTAYLAKWQEDRRKWKKDLKDRVKRTQSEQPVPFDAHQNFEEYQKVFLEGKFDYSKQAFLGPRHDSSEISDLVGFCIVTPFVTECGHRIMVNRGIVHEKLIGNSQLINKPEGTCKFVGLARLKNESVFCVGI